jgi:hypothetical protein
VEAVARTPREVVRRLVNELHDERVQAGRCKYDNGKPPHPPPTKSFRRKDGKPTLCAPCHEKKVDATRERRRRKRAAPDG